MEDELLLPQSMAKNFSGLLGLGGGLQYMGEGVENEKETGVYLTRERKNGAMKQFEFLKIFFKEHGKRLKCKCILKKRRQ